MKLQILLGIFSLLGILAYRVAAEEEGSCTEEVMVQEDMNLVKCADFRAKGIPWTVPLTRDAFKIMDRKLYEKQDQYGTLTNETWLNVA